MLTILPLEMNKLEPGPFQNLHIIAQHGEIHLEQDCLLQGQAQLDQWVVFCFSTLRLRSKKQYP